MSSGRQPSQNAYIGRHGLANVMFRKILWAITLRILRFLSHPSLRYSSGFYGAQDILVYSSTEEMLRNAFEYVSHNRLEGDYLEFGVAAGDSFVAAYHFAQLVHIKSMRFYAFDSFEGLPEITGIDAQGFREFGKGQFACDIDKFKSIISKKGIDSSKIGIIPGWYNEVLNRETKKKLSIRKASIIMIDCDLYESTVPVLNFVTDYLQNGAILIFDDWFCFRGDPNRGQQRASGEWLKKNPSIRMVEFRRFHWHGNSFIIYRKKS
jgi:O-methyltransferase